MWYLEAEPDTSPWTAPGSPLAPQGAPPPAPPETRGRRSASLLQRAKYLKLLLGCEDGSFAVGTCPLKHMRVSRPTACRLGGRGLAVPLSGPWHYCQLVGVTLRGIAEVRAVGEA